MSKKVSIEDLAQTVPWIKEFWDKYNSGLAHAFILHGNVSDYVVGQTKLTQFIGRMFPNRLAMVFDRAGGVQFPIQEDRIKVLNILKEANGGTPVNLSTGPEALFQIDKIMRANEPGKDEPVKTLLIVNFAETLFPEAAIATMQPGDRSLAVLATKWGTDPVLAGRSQVIVFITENDTDINQSIRGSLGRFESIEVGMPSKESKSDFVNTLISRHGLRMEEGMTIESVVNTTRELSLIGLEDIAISAKTEGGVLRKDSIMRRKNQIVRSNYGEVLETPTRTFGFERIGGMQYLKDAFMRYVILPLRNGDKKTASKGVLMMGSGGLGKSYFAQAIAGEAGVNFFKLNIGGQIASMYQGEGERKLRKAINGIEASGGIVFIDELDQVLKRGTGAGGSQQDDRLFQMVMEWLADDARRGNTCILAATNRPDLLDQALIRAGRFDQKVGFFPPDRSERKLLLDLMCKEQFARVVDIPEEVLSATEFASPTFGRLGWSHAELRNLVIKAGRYIDEQKAGDHGEALMMAVTKVRPNTKMSEEMSVLAYQSIDDYDLLPDWVVSATAPKERVEEEEFYRGGRG